MIIANPIYDVVFKKLMENERVARFFIGTLLNQLVDTVEVQPQEFTYTNEMVGIAVFRLDFIATIKTETGEYRKVLIEIQKARNPIDLMRFRNYLAEQYKREDKIEGRPTTLPITTIYILGFRLPEIDSPCIKVERNYRDLVNNTVILAKSYFIENLTHDCFVVQVERITGRYQTRLDKLLSVFEQSHFVDERKVVKDFQHERDIEEIKIMTDILHYTGTDPAEKKEIETEQEAWRTIEALLGDERQNLLEAMQKLDAARKQLEASNQKIAERNRALEEKNRTLEEKDRTLVEKDRTLEEKDRTLEEKDRTLEEKDRTLEEKDRTLEEKDRMIEELLKRLGE